MVKTPLKRTHSWKLDAVKTIVSPWSCITFKVRILDGFDWEKSFFKWSRNAPLSAFLF